MAQMSMWFGIYLEYSASEGLHFQSPFKFLQFHIGIKGLQTVMHNTSGNLRVNRSCDIESTLVLVVLAWVMAVCTGAAAQCSLKLNELLLFVWLCVWICVELSESMLIYSQDELLNIGIRHQLPITSAFNHSH